ncbi:LacI family DNA-binding transcriptional regulator [Fodinibius salsisoli]|uniref:LacI family DNA-binding transcriptional regulator n=1 Tax=Fodinibius salsisoli TaxID=2820877 RepID=A0ABT3PMI4_9BACT|nr:LacI family DNA-binding transcriptional regulator [Fodinibius salsisoli]MCW9707160.1 LacI family DNA-binding transcriptional regulator [Fodinibius salsisoli]
MSNTIYDIARQAGVSIATVSRVFNESPNVSSKTRKKVQNVAKEMGYQPQGMAQGLARRKKNVIMAVVPLLSNYFFLQVLNGIQDAISETNFELHIYNVKSSEKPVDQLKRLLGRRWADGYLFVSIHLSDSEWKMISQFDQQMVLIDDAYSACNYFQVNNKQGARKATRYFLEHGFKRIALITAKEESIPAAKRRQGYIQTLTDWGLTPDESLIVSGDTQYRDGFNEENGYEAMQKLLEQTPNPEAVVCMSDIQAIGAISAMKEQNLSLPIIGYDDIQLAKYIGLSTMRQPMYKMGKEGTNVLLDQIGKDQPKVVQKEYIPDLILRSTSSQQN